MASLEIAIIGAGIAGLATAFAISRENPNHRITIFDSVAELAEIGAGLNIASNATRILFEWGLQEEFRKVAVESKHMIFRRYDNDAELGATLQNPTKDSHPWWQLYRPDLQRVLKDACEGLGEERVKLVLGKGVQSVDPENGKLVFKDGSEIVVDFIVGADGIRSPTRPCIPANANTPAQATREYCFRAVVPRERMLSDPMTAELMEADVSNLWMGPGASMMGYSVSAGKLYNFVLTQPRDADPRYVGRWGEPGDIREAAKILEPFSKRLQMLWSKVSECNKWTIGHLPLIPTFVSDSGKVVLVGDAAHAMVPHAGQGAGMAVEDAATLAVFLSSLHSAGDLPKLMALYSDFRRTRVKNVQRMAEGNQHMFAMPDGPGQEKRDQMLGAMTAQYRAQLAELGEEAYAEKLRSVEPDPDATSITTPGARRYVHGYEAVAEARKVVIASGLTRLL